MSVPFSTQTKWRQSSAASGVTDFERWLFAFGRHTRRSAPPSSVNDRPHPVTGSVRRYSDVSVPSTWHWAESATAKYGWNASDTSKGAVPVFSPTMVTVSRSLRRTDTVRAKSCGKTLRVSSSDSSLSVTSLSQDAWRLLPTTLNTRSRTSPCRFESAGPRPANHGQQSGMPPVPVSDAKNTSLPPTGT